MTREPYLYAAHIHHNACLCTSSRRYILSLTTLAHHEFQRFPKSSEQYRIRGKLQFIGNNGPLYSYNESSKNICNNQNYLIAERKQQWGNLSDMAREQFYWEDPGIPHTTTWADGKGIPVGGRDDDGKVLESPDTFLLVLLYPSAVDYLRLGDNFRQIDRWEDGRWISTRVNP